MLHAPLKRLGAELPRRQGNFRSTKVVNHVATFIFKYRPIGESDATRLLVADRFSIHEFAAVLQADGIAPLPRRSDHSHSASTLNDVNFIDLTVKDENDTSERSKVGFL